MMTQAFLALVPLDDRFFHHLSQYLFTKPRMVPQNLRQEVHLLRTIPIFRRDPNQSCSASGRCEMLRMFLSRPTMKSHLLHLLHLQMNNRMNHLFSLMPVPTRTFLGLPPALLLQEIMAQQTILTAPPDLLPLGWAGKPVS